MGFAGSRLIILLFYVFFVNEIRLPTVTCQTDDGYMHCIPKKTFLALLRHPEVSSNLAAYSRTARVIQDAKTRDDFAQLKALGSEEGDQTEICIPGNIFLELLRDPTMRAHLNVLARAPKRPEYTGRIFEDTEENMEKDDIADSVVDTGKRSIATLAKNDDLPISLRDRQDESDDETKRSISSSEGLDSFLRTILEEELRRNPEFLKEYMLPGGDLDMDALTRDFSIGKRNVGTLARDFALPTGRRNIASLARDYSLPYGKRNIGSVAKERKMPFGKRNIASLAGMYPLPQSNEKRNVASVARDYGLPYGKRYAGFLPRAAGFPMRYDKDERNIDMSARNFEFPFTKRSRRSVKDKVFTYIRWMCEEKQRKFPNSRSSVKRNAPASGSDRANATERSKRQADFSEEYPLPVLQNPNYPDFEAAIKALSEQYPRAEKRFMGAGSAPETDSYNAIDPQYPEVSQPNKRHIGALARLGWLPSFRTARFSRSPRYLNERQDSTNGTTTDYPSKPLVRPLTSTGSQLRDFILFATLNCDWNPADLPGVDVLDSYQQPSYDFCLCNLKKK